MTIITIARHLSGSAMHIEKVGFRMRVIYGSTVSSEEVTVYVNRHPLLNRSGEIFEQLHFRTMRKIRDTL